MTPPNSKLIYVLDDIKRFNQRHFLEENIKNTLDLHIDFNSNIFTDSHSSAESIINYFVQLPHKIVCIHSSFTISINLESYILSSLIREQFLNLTNKYFIEFSGGVQSCIISEKYLKVEVKTFYSNLPFLIDGYLHKNKILPEILIFGENYKLIPLLKLYEAIKERFYFNPTSPVHNQKLIKFIEESLQDYSELQNDKARLITWISKNNNIDKADLFYVIEKWISEYI